MDRLSPVPESPARPRGHGGSEVVPSSPGSGSCPLPPGDDDLWPRQPGNDLCPWSPTLEDDLCPCSPQQLHDLCPCSPTLDLCPHSGCLDGPCPDLPPDPLPSGLTCDPAQPAEAQSDPMTPDACSLAATTTANSPPTACSPSTLPPSACSPPITAANSPPIACSPVTGANSPPSVSEPPSACPSPAAPPSACSPLSTGSSPSACDSPPACSSPLSDCSPPSAGDPWTLGDPWSACSPPPGEGSPPAVRTPPRCGPGPYPSHNSCKTLKCPWCNWRYKYRRTLEAHVRDKHGGGAQARCPHCRGGAPHPRLARGLAHPCGYRPFRCRPCDYATTTKGNLSIHRQSEQHQARLRALTPTLGANTVTARLRALTPTLGANNPLPITARAPGLISSPPLYPQTRTEGGHLTGSQVACGEGGAAGQRSSTEGDEVAGGEEGIDGQTTAQNLRAEVSGGLRCPLCADTLSDPGSLRSHLTLGHSVVSGCVARLLPTAAVVKCSLGSETPPICTEPGLESRPPSQHSQGTGRSGVEVFGAWDQVVSLPRDGNAEGQGLEQWTTAVVGVGRSPVPSAQALCEGGGPLGEEEEAEEAGLAASLRPGACPVRRAHNCPACRVSVTQRAVPLAHRSSLGPAPDTPASHRPRPSSLLQVQAPDPAQDQAEAVMQAQASVQTQPGAEIQAQVSSPAEDPPEAGIQGQAQDQADIQAQASVQAQHEAEIQAQASDQAPDAGQAPAEALSQLGCLGPESLRGERADPNLSPGAFLPSAPVWDGSPGSRPCREGLPRAGGLKRKLEGERGEEEAGRRGRRDKRARAPSSPQQEGASRDPSPPGRPEPQAWAQSSALPSCQETARPSSTRPKPVPRPPALPGCREIARPSSTRPDVSPRPQALPVCRETAPPSPGRPDGGGPRRCRTQMSGLQLEVMRACFRQRRAPSVPECQALAAQIGLPRRVVQIWFQNARAKEKRGVLGPGAGPGLGSGAACSLGCRPSPTGLGHVFTGPHISRVKELVLGRLRQGLNAGPAQDTAQDPAPAHHSPRDPPLPLQALPLPGLPPLLLPGPSNTSGPTAPTPGLSSSPLLCVGAPSLVPVQSAIPQLGEGEGESVGRGFLSPLLPYLLPPLLSPQPPLTYPLPLSLQGGEEVPRALGPALLGLLPQAWLQKALLCSSLGLGLGCPEPGPGAQASSLPGPQPPVGGESSAGPGPEALSAGAGPGLEPGLRAYPAGP